MELPLCFEHCSPTEAAALGPKCLTFPHITWPLALENEIDARDMLSIWWEGREHATTAETAVDKPA
jgi:hypothetical protein